ncbi:MAG: DUF2064 domain-containing protein [Anaerolineaceae bacterium]|nr:DUF2064 domain-containing protein [Anaerolineaceae bacterium]
MVILFSRFPEPGRVKSRLAGAIGDHRAAELHRRLVERVLATLRRIEAAGKISLELHTTGGRPAEWREWLGDGLRLFEQAGDDLGRRMAAAMLSAFGRGANKVLLVGADIPSLGPGVIECAAAALDDHDLVFGPTDDGGYYLVGATRRAAAEPGGFSGLFEGLTWGAETVLRDSLAKAAGAGFPAATVDVLSDIDWPEDLVVAERTIGGDFFEVRPGLISVIVPALDEAPGLPRVLAAASAGREVEIIVVDGGSHDATIEVARRGGARVITTRCGRWRQMNAGAGVSRGQVLLFLHADTRLPAGWAEEVRRVLAGRSVVAGAFGLRYDSPRIGMRLIELTNSLRLLLSRTPYGDQVLFVRRDIFVALGGYSPLPILEDVDLVRRLKRTGRMGRSGQKVLTSARRYQRQGILRTGWTNRKIMIAYRLGVPLQRIARWRLRE